MPSASCVRCDATGTGIRSTFPGCRAPPPALDGVDLSANDNDSMRGTVLSCLSLHSWEHVHLMHRDPDEVASP